MKCFEVIKYHIHKNVISLPILCDQHIQFIRIHSSTRHCHFDGGYNGLEPAGGLCKLLLANSDSFLDAAEDRVRLSVYCQTGKDSQTRLLTSHHALLGWKARERICCLAIKRLKSVSFSYRINNLGWAISKPRPVSMPKKGFWMLLPSWVGHGYLWLRGWIGCDTSGQVHLPVRV